MNALNSNLKIIKFTFLFAITISYAQKQIECDKFIDILNENRILVEKNKSIGVIDTIGNVIVDFKYKQPYRISVPKEDINYNYYNNKLISLVEISSKKRVLINLDTGKNIVEKYKNIYKIFLRNNYAIIVIKDTKDFFSNKNEKRFFINSKGDKLFDIKKENTYSFQIPGYVTENKICVLTNPSSGYNKYIYTDTLGKKLFNKTYELAGEFHNGRAVIAKIINGVYKYGFIDSNGKQVIDFKYTKRPTDFSNNISRVETKSKKFGYININGDLIIKPKYTFATGFFEGLALVREGYYLNYGNWKIIDKNDKVIKEFPTIKEIISANYQYASPPQKINTIKQILKEKLFKVKFNGKHPIFPYETVIINIDLDVIFDNKKIQIEKFKYGLAKFSFYDKNSKNFNYGIINKDKKILLINTPDQF